VSRKAGENNRVVFQNESDSNDAFRFCIVEEQVDVCAMELFSGIRTEMKQLHEIFMDRVVCTTRAGTRIGFYFTVAVIDVLFNCD
jgi:hypothetical protein